MKEAAQDLIKPPTTRNSNTPSNMNKSKTLEALKNVAKISQDFTEKFNTGEEPRVGGIPAIPPIKPTINKKTRVIVPEIASE